MNDNRESLHDGSESLPAAAAGNAESGAAPAEIVHQLESLDDVIFPAIEGDEQALQRAEPVWREAVATLGPDAVRESRNEYLRYARSTWEFLRRNATADRARLMAVLKIILLLSGLDT